MNEILDVVNSRTSLDLLALNEIATFKEVTVECRQRVLSIALGIVLAYQAPLPTTEVDGIINYYQNSVRFFMNDIISAFNERMVIDTKLVEETAYQFWSLRYVAVHPLDTVTTGAGCCDTFSFLFQVPTFVRNDIIETVNKDGIAIVALVNAITALIKRR